MRGLGDLSAEFGEVSGRFGPAVPDDRRDARPQGTGRHPVAHRADPEHRDRLLRLCHRFLLPECPPGHA
jgi:hypothetical protein